MGLGRRCRWAFILSIFGIASLLTQIVKVADNTASLWACWSRLRILDDTPGFQHVFSDEVCPSSLKPHSRTPTGPFNAIQDLMWS